MNNSMLLQYSIFTVLRNVKCYWFWCFLTLLTDTTFTIMLFIFLEEMCLIYNKKQVRKKWTRYITLWRRKMKIVNWFGWLHTTVFQIKSIHFQQFLVLLLFYKHRLPSVSLVFLIWGIIFVICSLLYSLKLLLDKMPYNYRIIIELF